MTPQDLYNRVPEREDNNLHVLIGCFFNHIPEVATFMDLKPALLIENERVLIRYYKDHVFDNKYIWRLASVWFDGKPVMLIQNAGLAGEEFNRRLITDALLYLELIQYLKGLLTNAFLSPEDLVDPTAEISGLDSFHGSILDSSFVPSAHPLLSGVWPYELNTN